MKKLGATLNGMSGDNQAPALHCSLLNRGAAHRAPAPSFFLFALFALLGCASAAFAGTEYAYCYVGTTGLNKASFTYLYENTDDQSSVSTSSLTCTEDPASSGWYYFDALEDPTANYRLAVSYGGNIVCDYQYPHGGAPFTVTWNNSYTVSYTANTFKQGDTRPTITLTATGFTSDCTSGTWTAKFNMWNARTNTVKLDDVTATVTCTASGSTYTLAFTYTPASTAFNMADALATEATVQYLGEFKLTNPTGTDIYTFPTNDSMKIQVVRKR